MFLINISGYQAYEELKLPKAHLWLRGDVGRGLDISLYSTQETTGAHGGERASPKTSGWWATEPQPEGGLPRGASFVPPLVMYLFREMV